MVFRGLEMKPEWLIKWKEAVGKRWTEEEI